MKRKSKSTDGWISVKTRLPENSRTVLIHMFKRDVFFGQCTLGKWSWIDGGEIDDEVHHWREMPEPPKGKK